MIIAENKTYFLDFLEYIIEEGTKGNEVTVTKEHQKEFIKENISNFADLTEFFNELITLKQVTYKDKNEKYREIYINFEGGI